MTSACWQSQWEKSILTLCVIYRVTNKGHSCSSTLGAAWGKYWGLLGYPSDGPCRLCMVLLLNTQTDTITCKGCTLHPYKTSLTFALSFNEVLQELWLTVKKQVQAGPQGRIRRMRVCVGGADLTLMCWTQTMIWGTWESEGTEDPLG